MNVNKYVVKNRIQDCAEIPEYSIREFLRLG